MAKSRFITLAPESARSSLSSDLVVTSDLGFVSGVRPVDLHNDRATIPEKVEAQTQKIFENLDLILASAGLDRKHITFVRIHLIDFDRLYDRMNKAYLQCIGNNPLPARSCVGVSTLTRGAMVEMDFIVRTSD